jgi:hypothetical protein
MRHKKDKASNSAAGRINSRLERREFLKRAAVVGSALFSTGLIPFAQAEAFAGDMPWKPSRDFFMLIGVSVMVPEIGNLFVSDPVAAALRAGVHLNEGDKNWLRSIPNLGMLGPRLAMARNALYGGRKAVGIQQE